MHRVLNTARRRADYFFGGLAVFLSFLLSAPPLFAEEVSGADGAENLKVAALREKKLTPSTNAECAAAPLLCRAGRLLEESYDADMEYEYREGLSEEEREKFACLAKTRAVESLKLLRESLKKEGESALTWGRISQAVGMKMKYESVFSQIMDLGDFHEAIDAALRLDPRNLDALLSRGYEVLYTPSPFVDEEKEARIIFIEAAGYHPKSGAPCHALGDVAMEEEKYAEAAEWFEKAYALDPGDLGAKALAARAWKLTGDADKERTPVKAAER